MIRPAPASPAGPTLATVLVFVGATLAATVWFWTRFCEFPALPWNDIRLAPTIALAQGWPVYPTLASGTINTWTYGPLPLLFLLPAAWAPTAADAMMAASGLNLLLTLVPVALVCFGWPAADRSADSRVARLAAFLLCLALWPARYYEMLYADNLAIACGLTGNLLLIRATSARGLWLAALLSTASIGCKQTALGLPLAQIAWLAFTAGRGPALRHALRCGLAGAALGAVCVGAFGWPGLRFILLELPAHFRWVDDPVERIAANGFELVVQVGAPLASLALARRVLHRPEWLLPVLAWACALPLGLAALMKFGGRMNSMHGFALWLPAMLTLGLTALNRKKALRFGWFAAAALAMALLLSRILRAPVLAMQPQLSAYRQAEKLTAQFPGQIWFPFHPLVTLYSERRYYHDEDGLYVRASTHKDVPPAHLASGLPPSLRMIAFHQSWSDWGIARRLIDPPVLSIPAGDWMLLSRGAPP